MYNNSNYYRHNFVYYFIFLPPGLSIACYTRTLDFLCPLKFNQKSYRSTVSERLFISLAQSIPITLHNGPACKVCNSYMMTPTFFEHLHFLDTSSQYVPWWRYLQTVLISSTEVSSKSDCNAKNNNNNWRRLST